MAYLTVIDARKKYIYWDLYSKEFRYALEYRGKSFPFLHMWKLFMNFQKLLGAYVYVICLADSNPPLSYSKTPLIEL